jgi:hypothetical protein
MNTLAAAGRRLGANAIVRESRYLRAPATFPSPALQALLTWREGHDRRNCAARLLHAGLGEIALIVFGSPAPGTAVRLHFIDPPWCGAARVTEVVPDVHSQGSCRTRLKLDRRSWSEWKLAFRSACRYSPGGR